jgi:hypothetical protein
MVVVVPEAAPFAKPIVPVEVAFTPKTGVLEIEGTPVALVDKTPLFPVAKPATVLAAEEYNI